tara:strand:- start:299 stop:856 length:558 start_codon:yes stop_codon:yes gene_type:complete
MIYFGQEVGEPGAEYAGFGTPSRTSIFDYIGVPHHQRWANNGLFDGGQLSDAETHLRNFYRKLLNVTLSSPALCGEYHDLYAANFEHFGDMQNKLYTFARSCSEQKVIIATNFCDQHGRSQTLQIPHSLVQHWALNDGDCPCQDLLNDTRYTLKVSDGSGCIEVDLPPLATLFIEIQPFVQEEQQ